MNARMPALDSNHRDRAFRGYHFAVRRAALPTSFVPALLAGLVAGGVSAIAYALHCTADSCRLLRCGTVDDCLCTLAGAAWGRVCSLVRDVLHVSVRLQPERGAPNSSSERMRCFEQGWSRTSQPNTFERFPSAAAGAISATGPMRARPSPTRAIGRARFQAERPEHNCGVRNAI